MSTFKKLFVFLSFLNINGDKLYHGNDSMRDDTLPGDTM